MCAREHVAGLADVGMEEQVEHEKERKPVNFPGELMVELREYSFPRAGS